MGNAMTNQGKFKTYLFSYQHNGSRWGFEIMAASPEDARARVAKIAYAAYDGELVASIPVPGILERIVCKLTGRS